MTIIILVNTLGRYRWKLTANSLVSGLQKKCFTVAWQALQFHHLYVFHSSSHLSVSLLSESRAERHPSWEYVPAAVSVIHIILYCQNCFKLVHIISKNFHVPHHEGGTSWIKPPLCLSLLCSLTLSVVSPLQLVWDLGSQSGFNLASWNVDQLLPLVTILSLLWLLIVTVD